MIADRIEKTITLNAPQSRVWAAIADADQFGAWFGVQLDGPFRAGERVTGRILTPGYDHLTLELWVERVEPESLFAYRWHPHAVDAAVDYSGEPTTLVEFRLAPVPEGTSLTVIESGFSHVPASRRDRAFEMNSQGWSIQVQRIAAYVAGGGGASAAGAGQ